MEGLLKREDLDENVKAQLGTLKAEYFSLKSTVKDQKDNIDMLKIRLDKANSKPDVFENLHYKKLQSEFEEYKDKAV